MSINLYIDDKVVFQNADWGILFDIEYNFSEEKDVNVLCVGIKKNIDENYIKQFPNLQYILSPSTGLTHISEEVKNRVKVINLIPGEVKDIDLSSIKDISASSEFTVILTLSLLRRMNEIFCGKNNIVGEDIQGKTVGILGHGRIGKNVHKIFEAMGAKVIWHDILHVEGLSKKDILELSDIIVVLISCTKENAHYIDYQDFSDMKKCPYFINITRGFIVNNRALLNALLTKKIKGAALDVTDNISVFDDYLKNNDNLIITPHVAGSTYQSYKKACDFVIEKLKNEIIK